MASGRRRTAVPEDGFTGEDKGSVGEEPSLVPDEQLSFESEVATLRRRWELASVLNFLSVFKPVTGKDLKWLPADQIEMALIQPNSLLAQIHIALLKGIPPPCKTLDGPKSVDAWVAVLCKKLEPWWKWVAEGEFPLNDADGEELSRYKELSPTNRLLILKALCELRVEQYDAVYHVSDSLKDRVGISSFRIKEIGCDGNHTSYWFDANEVTGYRLYKEVKTNVKTKLKGKSLTTPTTRFQWETLATNLEEFRKVAEELASSNVPALVAVGKTIEADAVSVIEKRLKYKESALRRKEREEKFRNSYRVSSRITRTCRIQKPVSYKYDGYDRVIKEAIQLTKNGVNSQKRKRGAKHVDHEGSDTDMDLKVSPGTEGDDFMNNESENGKLHELTTDDEKDSDDNSSNSNSDKDSNDNPTGSDKDYDQSKPGSNRQVIATRSPAAKNRLRQRLTRNSALDSIATRSPAAKNRSRQRITRNSALDSIVISDSDDGNLEKNNLYAADSEEQPVEC